MRKSFREPMVGTVTFDGQVSKENAVEALKAIVGKLGYMTEVLDDGSTLCFSPKGSPRKPQAILYRVVSIHSSAKGAYLADPEDSFSHGGGISFGDPYSFMRKKGESVYLGTVDRRDTVAGNPTLVLGTATINIVKVLDGPKLDSLSLPFRYPNHQLPAARPIQSSWPDLEAMPHGHLILVVVGKGRDPNDRTALDPIPVADFVYPIGDIKSVIVNDFQTIIALRDVAQADLKMDLMKAAASGPYVPLMLYIEAAARQQLPRQDYLDVLHELVVHYKYKFPNALDAAISSCVGGDPELQEIPKAERSPVLAILLDMLKSEDGAVLQSGLRNWRQVIRMYPGRASELLTQEQIKTLVDSLASARARLSTSGEISKDDEDVGLSISNWIQGK